MLMKKSVAIAMSGGVDSSVAAYLLKQQGLDVFGMFMRLGEGDKELQSEAAARRVCAKLEIRFIPVNIADEFKRDVVEYFLSSYESGLTPNPCSRCNQMIKFGALLQRAQELGMEMLATGHYARIVIDDRGIRHLYRPADKSKDQTYFLSLLHQEQLSNVMFPLADLAKEEVRRIADRESLPYVRAESQDVCFLSGDHNDFLRERLRLDPGDIKMMDGRTIGRHQGLPLYTIGQRRGIEIGGTGPFFVADRDFETNVLYVTSDGQSPELYRDKLEFSHANFISEKEPDFPLECEVVIRYRHPAVSCLIEKITEGRFAVKFKKPQRAIAAGQTIAIFAGDEALGGGEIL